MSVQSLFIRHGANEPRICFAAVQGSTSEEFLSASEKEQLADFKFAAKQESFRLGRLAAKRALGALLEEPDLPRIEIRSGIYGQPLVHHPRAGSMEVSLSHSHGFAVALAFPAEYPMGIDLETVAAVSAATIIPELGASPPELTWLAAAGVARSTTGLDQATACGVLWTAREALGKSLHIGLNSPLGMLALSEIQNTGEGTWAGRYLNFPQCQCLSQVKDGRVLSVALPREAALSAQLQLDQQS